MVYYSRAMPCYAFSRGVQALGDKRRTARPYPPLLKKEREKNNEKNCFVVALCLTDFYLGQLHQVGPGHFAGQCRALGAVRPRAGHQRQVALPACVKDAFSTGASLWGRLAHQKSGACHFFEFTGDVCHIPAECTNALPHTGHPALSGCCAYAIHSVTGKYPEYC